MHENEEAPRQGASGKVFLIGAGPGGADLMTVRAVRLLGQADVILYDQLVDPEVLDLADPAAERINVGKRRSNHTLPQEEIGALMVALAREGRTVARLKGGDPFIFGRGGEEMEVLAENGVSFEVCPGVTAASGCSALAGIPLTHRDHAQSLVFVTAHDRRGLIDLDWAGLIRPNQTVALYMGLTYLEDLTRAFIAHGAPGDLPAAAIEKGTRPDQRVVVATLETLSGRVRKAGLKSPTLILIGTVVSLRAKLFGPDPPPQPADGTRSG